MERESEKEMQIGLTLPFQTKMHIRIFSHFDQIKNFLFSLFFLHVILHCRGFLYKEWVGCNSAILFVGAGLLAALPGAAAIGLGSGGCHGPQARLVSAVSAAKKCYGECLGR